MVNLFKELETELVNDFKAKQEKSHQESARALMREKELRTNRGGLRRWYHEELQKGLNTKQVDAVEAFVDDELANLRSALQHDWARQEIYITLRQDGIKSVRELKSTYRHRIQADVLSHKKLSQQYFQNACTAGEITKLEEFVSKLREK